METPVGTAVGHWTVSVHPSQITVNAGPTFCVADCGAGPGAYENARLIAAAPELLALLEELAQMAEDDAALYADQSAAKPFYLTHADRILLAIKNARGE